MLSEKINNCDYFLSPYIDLSVFLVINILLVTFLIAYFYKKPNKYMTDKVGLFLVLSGGGLNMWERFFSGCVKDYMVFFNLFVFNLNDVLIVTGLVLLTVGMFQPKIMKGVKDE
jgi:lipoprotein signal peptidase